MATLTNTKIKDTYDGLLKTTDNEALDVSGVTLIEDGLGNASAISIGRANNGVTITGALGIGTSNPSAAFSIDAVKPIRAENFTLRSNSTAPAEAAFIYRPVTGVLGFGTANTERMRIDSSGRVGIGLTPSMRFQVKSSGNTTEDVASFGNANISDGLVVTTNGNLDWGLNARNSRNLTFSTNQSERMRIDSSGRLGIGTSSPASILEISKNDQTNGATLSITNSFSGSGWASGDTIGTINFRIDDASTSEPVRGQIKLFDDASPGSTYPANNAMSFSTANTNTLTERMRITSSGDVLIGTTTAISSIGNTIQVKNNSNLAYFQYSSSSGTGSIVFRNASNSTVGTIAISNTATAYNTSSDYRLKENVVEMTGALDRVDALKPSRFNFIGEDRTVDGFLAHEVQAIVPEAVTGEKDAVDEEGNPIYQGIDQSKIVPLLVGAIKELRAEIELLKAK